VEKLAAQYADAFTNKMYGLISDLVWGNIPTDKNWAMESNIFKDFITKHGITTNTKPADLDNMFYSEEQRIITKNKIEELNK
jgi:hypothetical protein